MKLTNRFEVLDVENTPIEAPSALIADSNTRTNNTSPKQLRFEKDPVLCLNMIADNFDFCTDNMSACTELRGARRNSRLSKYTNKRYAVCEFGENTPLQMSSKADPKSKDAIFAAKIHQGVSETKDEALKTFGRILNVNNKNDRQRLRKMKQSLEALKKMAQSQSSRSDPFKMYKELPGTGVNLFTQEKFSGTSLKFL